MYYIIQDPLFTIFTSFYNICLMPLKDFMEVLPLICIMAAIGNVLHDTVHMHTCVIQFGHADSDGHSLR